MTSLLTSTRQTNVNDAYFIPLASLYNQVYSYNPTAGQASFSTATWAAKGTAGVAKYASSISTAGAGILRDMGKTVVSSSRTFRKVQLVVSSASTFGVGGAQGAAVVEDYLTGYIELGFEGPGNFAPVAKYGR